MPSASKQTPSPPTRRTKDGVGVPMGRTVWHPRCVRPDGRYRCLEVSPDHHTGRPIARAIDGSGYRDIGECYVSLARMLADLQR